MITQTADTRSEQAACRDSDPELFFPVGTSGPALQQIAAAKRVCSTCPIRQACLDRALATGEQHGIFGGHTEQERRVLAGRTVKGSARPAGLIDRVVVDRLVQAGEEPGATRDEITAAALRLVQQHAWSASAVALHLHLPEREVQRWAARAAAGVEILKGRIA